MRLLLTTLNAKYIHINLAIRLLYELNASREGLEWKEFTIKQDQDEVAGQCADFEVVAFSCYIWNITQTLEVARKIKALRPGIKILLGGPEVSYDWQEVIQRPEVDFIITGEGEIPFRAFLDAYPDVEAVPNLAWKDVQGELHYRAESLMFDLENYQHSMPYRFDPPDELRNKVAYIETSRGCPYKCEFCLASLDNKVRYLPMDSIRDTLRHLMEHGRVIKFLDRTFNIKKTFTLEIFQFILENHRPGNVFQFEITADILHPDIIAFIREKVPEGLFRFEIGIQTVNQNANLEVSRKQDFEKTKAIIQALEDKVEMHLDLIVGLALDYWEDIKYSFETVFALFPPELQLGFLKFLKGTPVRDKFVEHGFVFDPEPPYQIIESNYLSKSALEQIEMLENALEIYWNKKRAPLTLRYAALQLGSFDFLLDLGKHFLKHRSFQAFTQTQSYEILFDFVQTKYPNDVHLPVLVALDYYGGSKMRPKLLFVQEPDKKQKMQYLEQIGENIHKNRYVVFPVHFDPQIFFSSNQIVEGAFTAVFRYTGTEPAAFINTRIAFDNGISVVPKISAS